MGHDVPVHRIEVRRQVAASPDRVWTVATDIHGSAAVLSGVQRVEMVRNGAFQVGTCWRETRRILGREQTEEMTVTDVSPGRSYRVESDSRGTHYVTDVRVTPAGAGTDLALTFSAEPQGRAQRALGRLLGGLAMKTVRAQMQRDLDDLARAAERG